MVRHLLHFRLRAVGKPWQMSLRQTPHRPPRIECDIDQSAGLTFASSDFSLTLAARKIDAQQRLTALAGNTSDCCPDVQIWKALCTIVCSQFENRIAHLNNTVESCNDATRALR